MCLEICNSHRLVPSSNSIQAFIVLEIDLGKLLRSRLSRYTGKPSLFTGLEFVTVPICMYTLRPVLDVYRTERAMKHTKTQENDKQYIDVVRFACCERALFRSDGMRHRYVDGILHTQDHV
jgi:TctA family transporter